MMKRSRLSRPFCVSMLAIAGLLVLSYFPLSRIRAANAGATILPSAGKPLVNLKTPQNLKLTYAGPADAVAALQAGTAIPTALASADFDADGAMDVVAGYSTKNSGVVVVMRGNPDAFAPTDLTLYGKAAKGNVPSTFLSKATVFSVPESPDLLATGDFNRDGDKDVLVASRGGALYLLAGDGHGNLLAPQAVPLPGQVTALAVTADAHVAVSTDGPNGPQLAMLAPGAQGLTAGAIYPLPARGDAMAWGSLGGGADLAVGAGANVVIFYNALATNPQTEMVTVPFEVKGLALGDFIWDRDGRTEISVLAGDGSIHILQHGTLNTTPLTAAELPARRTAIRGHHANPAVPPNPTAPGAWTVAKQIPYTGSAPSGPVSASAFSSPRLAESSTHDVMVLDAGRNQLNILDTSGKAASPSAGVSFSGTPVAALAMPQKINAGRDIVVLAAGQTAPMMIPSGGDPTFTVTTTVDIDPDAACTNPSVKSASGALSLREAVCLANNNAPATSTIDIGPGTYDLTSFESGELQIETSGTGYNLTINGTGAAANTIIKQTDGVDRIFEEDFAISGSNPLTIQNVTLTGGNCTNEGDCGFGGGAILAGGFTGDDLTITNVVMSSNGANPSGTGAAGPSNGGAIDFESPGGLTITSSTFSSNAASGGGGAILFQANGTGNVSVTGSTFSGNTTVISGGGISATLETGTTFTVSGSTFTGNSVTDGIGSGGGIFAEQDGTVTVSDSRFVGNSAGGGGAGASIEASTAGTLTDNWWGCNPGPGNSGCDSVLAAGGGTASFNPWLVLSISANPTQIALSGTSTLTADLTHNSSGGSGFSVPNGTPVAFGGTLDSSVNPSDTTLTSGQATSTYTAGSTAGAGTGTTMVDNQTVSTPINIVVPNLSVSKTHTGTFTQGSSATWNVVVSNTQSGSTTSGTTTVSDTLPNGYTISSFSAAGWSCSGTGTATCTSTQAVAGGSAFSAIQIIVNVPANSPTSVSNTAAAFGGGDQNHSTLGTAATGSDVATVNQVPASIIINGSSTQSTAVNTAFGSLAVTVTDAGSVVIPNYSGVTFTAIAGGSGQSGTFSNNTGTISVNTNGSGIANPGTFTANGIAGSYTVGVTAGSASAAFNLTNTAVIVAAPTATSVSSNNNPSFTAAPGNSVTLTATVTSGGSPVTDGTVSFTDNSIPLAGCTAVTLNGSGQATCTTSFTTEGTHPITATYNGTPAFLTSFGNLSQMVNNHTVVTGNQFCNQGAITVPGTAGAATPYPSNIFVTGLGNVGKVTLALNGISSSDIQQTDLLLVGPTGAAIVPFSSVGDGSTISGVNIVLDDAAASPIPGGSPLTSGTYLPTSITGSTSLVFPAPAPTITVANYAATDGAATLTSELGGTAANGTWALYAMDNSGNGAASIGGGWCVTITPATVQTTITTSPAGLLVSADGGTPVAAPLIETWVPGSSHTIATSSPQAGSPGVQYVFSAWSDSGAISHAITVPGTPTTFTANFNTQYQLTTQASPSADGSVTPASGSFFAGGAIVPVTATANAGFQFTNWTSTGGSFGSTTSPSTNFTMPSAPATVTGNFAAAPEQITITTSPANLLVSVDGGTFAAAPLVESWTAGSSHTIATTSPQAGGAGVQYVWSTWSDGGAISHSITVPSSATTYTASFSTQYQLTTAANPSNGGTVSPASGGFYASGAVVPLTATANAGYTFSNWTGSVANPNSASTTVTMSAPESVTANFTAPSVTVTPTNINFGTGYLYSLKDQNVTVKNTGTSSVTINSVSVTLGSGTNKDDFTLLNLCPKTLAAGKSCIVNVIFFAGNIGSLSATLNVNDNALGSPQQVSLSAIVINPQASYKPRSLNFGTVNIGHSSTKNVTLTNTGTTALDITSISITGADKADYSRSDACPSSLNPGADCIISVTFMPSNTGTRSADLTVVDNAAISTQNVALTGRGSN